MQVFRWVVVQHCLRFQGKGLSDGTPNAGRKAFV